MPHNIRKEAPQWLALAGRLAMLRLKGVAIAAGVAAVGALIYARGADIIYLFVAFDALLSGTALVSVIGSRIPLGSLAAYVALTGASLWLEWTLAPWLSQTLGL